MLAQTSQENPNVPIWNETDNKEESMLLDSIFMEQEENIPQEFSQEISPRK